MGKNLKRLYFAVHLKLTKQCKLTILQLFKRLKTIETRKKVMCAEMKEEENDERVQ